MNQFYRQLTRKALPTTLLALLLAVACAFCGIGFSAWDTAERQPGIIVYTDKLTAHIIVKTSFYHICKRSHVKKQNTRKAWQQKEHIGKCFFILHNTAPVG